MDDFLITFMKPLCEYLMVALTLLVIKGAPIIYIGKPEFIDAMLAKVGNYLQFSMLPAPIYNVVFDASSGPLRWIRVFAAVSLIAWIGKGFASI